VEEPQKLKRVLLTGASGFVGRPLAAILAQAGYEVRAATRTAGVVIPGVTRHVCIGEICAATDWKEALSGVDCVIHAAARAHRLSDTSSNAHAYMQTNAEGTSRLAKEALQCGVQRFVFLSTVKVNGEETGSRACTSVDEPHPQDVYGKSKWLAEQSLNEIARLSAIGEAGMDVAILRLPLVYGPGVRANFYRLMHWVDKQWPLPLGAVHNRRSLVSIWNLCDLVVRLLQIPSSAAGTWMISDGRDLSTPELIRGIATAMHRRARLVNVPVGVLRAVGTVTGHSAEVGRLCGSLAVDISQTRAALGWSPPMSIDEALSRTVAWYLAEGRK
jgi:UDP-glucose 4-epimerase